MMLTYKLKHGSDFSDELRKARQVAEFAIKTRTTTSKDVRHIGLKSAVANTKLCYKCKSTKTLSEFSTDKNRSDRHSADCKSCRKVFMKAYHRSGRFKIVSKTWRLNHPHSVWAKSTLRSHRIRGCIIDISVKELAEFARTVLKCPMCDCILDWSVGHKKGRLNKCSPSLDRTDNTNHISLENCQIICHRCNTTKSDRTVEEFVDYCRRIVDKYTPRSATLGATATLEPLRL